MFSSTLRKLVVLGLTWQYIDVGDSLPASRHACAPHSSLHSTVQPDDGIGNRFTKDAMSGACHALCASRCVVGVALPRLRGEEHRNRTWTSNAWPRSATCDVMCFLLSDDDSNDDDRAVAPNTHHLTPCASRYALSVHSRAFGTRQC